jgi:hypothetical protein
MFFVRLSYHQNKTQIDVKKLHLKARKYYAKKCYLQVAEADDTQRDCCSI